MILVDSETLTEKRSNMSTPRVKREFTEQYKKDAVLMVTELGKSRAQAARDLGINESTLGKWVSKALGTEGSGRGSHLRAPDPQSADPRELQREVDRLRQENEFLKKAAAFFAKNQ